MPSQEFCLMKAFKMCKSSKSSVNYEAIPYEKPQDNCDSAIKRQIELNRAKLQNLNNLKKQTTVRSLFTNEMPQFQSTQLEQSTGEESQAFYYLNVTDKITSTVIQHSSESMIVDDKPSLSQINDMSNTAFSNSYYRSPMARRSTSSNSDETSTLSGDSFEQSQAFSNSFSSADFQEVQPSFFNKQDAVIFVCNKPYTAKIEGDLSLKYADRVQLLHNNGQVVLVKNLLTSICGYVPIQNLISLENFLSMF